MNLYLLMGLALVTAANAEIGRLAKTCPPDWVLYRTKREASCLKIMPDPLLFDDAYKACLDIKAKLLSFSHRMEKVFFVNRMITDHLTQNSKEPNSMWFFDPTFLDTQISPKPELWMVLYTSTVKSKVALLPNSTVVPRNFVCEAPALPTAQRPQFQLEPEHLFIADILVHPASGSPPQPMDAANKEPKLFFATFNCQAYGIKKPTLEWHFIYKAENQSLIDEKIDAKVITDPRESLNNPSLTGVSFFNLQRDCPVPSKCPADSIAERSQLVVVNPQFLDLTKSIVCVAKNEFGSVFSQEAQFFISKMGEFAISNEDVSVRAGMATTISNAIMTQPDAGAADCYRSEKQADGTNLLIPIEDLNIKLQGAIQMSKSTFDLIIDGFRTEDAGDFVCRARIHNGRLSYLIREKTIKVKVDPCAQPDCNLETKPLKVVDGYPAVLSMNPLDNHVIQAGDDFLLECPCTGKRRPDEQMKVNWNLRNDTSMPVLAVGIFPPGSALLVPQADKDRHSGMYLCQCVRGTEVTDWHSVNVTVLPSIEPKDHKDILTVKPGASADLDCQVNADVAGLGVFVEPLHGIESLDDYLAKTGSAERIKVERNGPNHVTVKFTDAKESDSGIYGCRVTANYFGKWVEHDSFYTSVDVKSA